MLPDGFQSKLIKAAERGEVRRVKGSVGHVEVFRVGSVGTSIIGRPRRLSRDRRAHTGHPARTLNYEEPH
ncbi:hypothetical protein, partial [Arthrobacter echini]|uniref:hypothetical protein n=1 Tax=Arthrobacter echini TaxID=1529066 RepID=UPI001CA31DD4